MQLQNSLLPCCISVAKKLVGKVPLQSRSKVRYYFYHVDMSHEATLTVADFML